MTDNELLTWPIFSANQDEVAKALKEKGYTVKKIWKKVSGSDSLQELYFEISVADDVISKEAIDAVNKDISECSEHVKNYKLKQIDNEFEKNILDKQGILSFIKYNKYQKPQPQKRYYQDKYDYWFSVTSFDDGKIFLADREKLEKNKDQAIEIVRPDLLTTNIEKELKDKAYEAKLTLKYKEYDHFTYIVKGHELENVFWMDLDLSNPEDMQKALAQDSLRWPSFSALDKELAAKLEEHGYICRKVGRSGFDSRNRFNVMTQDGKLTSEVLEWLKQEVNNCRKILAEEKICAFDQYFDEQSPDKNKVYSVVENGNDFYLTRTQDSEKYDTIASDIVAFTADHRRNVGHTYKELLIHKERIKTDKRHVITFEVPQKMIGRIIGKGGANIKALGQKYGKHFKVIQDPGEIYRNNLTELHETFSTMLNNGTALSFDLSLSQYPWLNEKDKKELQEKFTSAVIEKEKQREKEAQLKHERDIYILTSNVMSYLGDMTSLPENEVVLKLAEFLRKNKDNTEIIPVQPNREELETIKQKAFEIREREIKRQQELKEAEHRYFMDAVHNQMLRVLEETGKVIEAEKLTQFINTKFEGKDPVRLQELKKEAFEERAEKERQFPQKVEKLREIYYNVIAAEITNRNGEIIRHACESNGSASRVFNALYDQAEEAGLKEEFYFINIAETPQDDSEAELYRHNVKFMEQFVVQDIEENGGYYDSDVCFYISKSLKKETAAEILPIQKQTEDVPSEPQISLKEAKAQAKGQKSKGKTNNLADLAMLLNGGKGSR